MENNEEHSSFRFEKLIIFLSLLLTPLHILPILGFQTDLAFSGQYHLRYILYAALGLGILLLILSLVGNKSDRRFSAILAIVGGLLTAPTGLLAVYGGGLVSIGLKTRKTIDWRLKLLGFLAVIFLAYLLYISLLAEVKKNINTHIQNIHSRIKNEQVRNRLTIDETKFLIEISSKARRKFPEAKTVEEFNEMLEYINSKSPGRNYLLEEWNEVLLAVMDYVGSKNK